MVELDHEFHTGKPADYNREAVTDLERVIPCVEGGSVLERTSDDEAKAEIKVKMGAMSMTFRGMVTVVEKDLVLVNVGGRDAGIVAFALDTGKEVWKATQDQASYSSPVLATIDGSRRRRIARGSGTSVQEVNELLNRFKEAQKMMKQMSKMKLPKALLRM